MAREPARSPGVPGASGAPVKRAVDDESVPAQWLEVEHLSQAESVDRLAADFELVSTLAFGNFEGREYQYFETELARYGMAVIAGWMRRGMIYERCKSRGYGGLPELGRPFDDDEIEEITGETISKALVHFRKDVLMTQKWDYRKGATLRTYFVGQCLIRFANVYRRWWGSESRNRYDLTDDNETLEMFSPRSSGADGRAIDRAIAMEVISLVKDPRVQKAMLLTAAGWSQAEIAEQLGINEKTVERMLANERSRLKRRRAG